MLLYYGYTGSLATYLHSRGLEPGDKVFVKLKDGTILKGLLMPRPQLYESSSIIVLKLENGYNIGVDFARIEEIELVEKYKPRSTSTPPKHP
ncbi:MAG: Glu-tRNA(Gln) amidotransferase GatDE subunit D, partial [Desulfurococcaceae archaeon]